MTLPSSYHKANNIDDGPFRKVTHTEVLDNGNIGEVLECGHRGKVFYPGAVYAGKRRRCWWCRPRPCTECGGEGRIVGGGMVGACENCDGRGTV